MTGPVVGAAEASALGAPAIVSLATMLPVLSLPDARPGSEPVALPVGARGAELLLDMVEEPGDGLAPLLSVPPGETAGLVLLPSVPELDVPAGETEPVPVPALPAPTPGEPAPLDGA